MREKISLAFDVAVFVVCCAAIVACIVGLLSINTPTLDRMAEQQAQEHALEKSAIELRTAIELRELASMTDAELNKPIFSH